MVVSDGILLQLVRKYAELAEFCYRVSVAYHDERGRLRRGHRSRTHPALLKKVDLDAALAQIYRRFFGDHDGGENTSASISNNRFHGSVTEKVTSPSSAPRQAKE